MNDDLQRLEGRESAFTQLMEKYEKLLATKAQGLKKLTQEYAHEIVSDYWKSPCYDFVLKICSDSKYDRIHHILWRDIVFPELEPRIKDDTRAMKALVETIQNLSSSVAHDKKLGYITAGELTCKILELEPNNDWARKKRVIQLNNWLAYSFHEWPTGVLNGINGASVEDCDSILTHINELRQLDPSEDTSSFCQDLEAKLSQYKQYLQAYQSCVLFLLSATGLFFQC